MGENEIFRDKVPWLDESVSIVGVQTSKKAKLKLVRLEKTGKEVNIHDICEFYDGEISFSMAQRFTTSSESPLATVTDAERLCLSVMPRGYNTTKMSEVLANPFWEYVIGHFRAAYVMES